MLKLIPNDNVIDDVVNGMKKILNFEQEKKLKQVLQINLYQYSIGQEIYELSTSFDENEKILKLFVASKRIEGKSEKTIAAYYPMIQKMLTTINKNYLYITSNDIKLYLALYKEERKISNTSLNNMRLYFMSFFKWLTIEEYIPKNPMLRIDVIKSEERIKDVITDENLEILRCSCKQERDLAIIDILSSTWMRVGELVKLNKEDIDFGDDECIIFGKGSRERPVYLTAKAKVHLLNYLENRSDDNSALFVSLNKPNDRLQETGIRAILNKVGEKSGISNLHIHPHKFRRSGATSAINKGMPAEHVQKILGHKSINTTLKCYCSLNNSTIKFSHQKYVN